jgi:1-acyl-sn-glycerol-3-phosphate acyltransferase
LSRIPASGPTIIITNHIGLVEIPILFTHLQPRPVTGLVAAVRWRNRLLAWILNACEAIPVRRGELDMDAMRRVLELLESGRQVIIFPEGTRSDNAQLQMGKPGVAFLASRTGVPIVPVAHYGGEELGHNVRRLRRTDFSIIVGDPFTMETHGVRVTATVRRQMTDEMMHRLSALLPPQYRGVYAHSDEATSQYLHELNR